MTPRATYRLQLHRDFTFADAERVVPYLDRLGISHLYQSPITTATAGSTHGYDVVDPTRINPELGGEDAYRSLVAAVRARGMGVVIDIVPNHMGVAGGANAWWNDVLALGPNSEYANVFDIDWSKPIVLPILGDPLPQALERADDAVAEGVRDAVRSGPATLPGVESTEGKAVLEMAVVQVSKGAALDTLREQLGADAVLFVGDDVTDETAFVRLRPGDVGIKVGPGETAAEHRIDTPEDVTLVLEELLAARRAS